MKALRVAKGLASRVRTRVHGPPTVQRIVFTVTAGRSGTRYLTRVASLLSGVRAEHEPQPSFRNVMRMRQDLGPEVAARWLPIKREHILRAGRPCYLETSHLFCKGFFEPWIEQWSAPDLILWSRSPRSIAKSLYELGMIPGKTPTARSWYLAPDDEGVLQLGSLEALHDYQRCFWYVLEIQRRQAAYGGIVRAAGGRTLAMSLSELNDEAGFRTLSRFLVDREPSALERWRFEAIAARRVNKKRGEKKHALPDGLDAMEAELHAALLQANDPDDVPSL